MTAFQRARSHSSSRLRRVFTVALALGGWLQPTLMAQVEIQGAVRRGSDLDLQVRAPAGTPCQLQASGTLATSSWGPVGAAFNATGTVQTITLTGAAGDPARFFRLSYTPLPPAGFAYIPDGAFLMGDQSTTTPQDGVPNERPVIQVTLPGFFLQKTEVSLAEWQATKTWGEANGYTFSSNSGQAKAADHPVTNTTWYDVVRWCNAKSEQEGREPCYFVGGTSTVYRTGIPSSVSWFINRNGFRLPTEAEWEKSARGGLTGQRFPWGNTIGHDRANYQATTTRPYDTSATTGFHPTYLTPGALPYTAPVNSFAPNGYGLLNLSGNVREMCWDNSGQDYAAGYTIDPTSGSESIRRVVRGGDWSVDGYAARCAYRDGRFPNTTDSKNNFTGFRLAWNL